MIRLASPGASGFRPVCLSDEIVPNRYRQTLTVNGVALPPAPHPVTLQ
jgi:hypothetical protein